MSHIVKNWLKEWHVLKAGTPEHRGRFPFTKNFGNFLLGIPGISVWEESIPFVTSPTRLQAPLRRSTKKPDALVNCSAIFSNASLFVAFPSNKWLLSACVIMRSLASACSRRSRFTVVETSPVNERTFQSCSCNILVFTRETCTGKESFEQARISTYHFYIRHIRAAINFHDLVLERGRQSTRSSPEVCLQKASRNLTRISRHFLETRGSPGKPGRLKDRERHGTDDKDEKFCKWNKFPLGRSNRENGTTF